MRSPRARVAAAIVATALAAASSQAATYSSSTLDPTQANQSVEFGSLLTSTGAFSDTFEFSFFGANVPSSVGIATGIQISFSGFTPDVDFTGVTLNGMAGSFSNVAEGLVNISFFTTPGVSALGSNLPAFSLVLSGQGVSGARYGGTLNVALVPEPHTYALMLAGLAALGFVAARRRRPDA